MRKELLQLICFYFRIFVVLIWINVTLCYGGVGYKYKLKKNGRIKRTLIKKNFNTRKKSLNNKKKKIARLYKKKSPIKWLIKKKNQFAEVNKNR